MYNKYPLSTCFVLDLTSISEIHFLPDRDSETDRKLLIRAVAEKGANGVPTWVRHNPERSVEHACA
jgi:hypothetical protein